MPATIAQWLEKWARATPDKPAIRFEGQTISYREFHQLAGRCAELLSAGLGVTAGDRVAWLSRNHPQQLITLFACARIGAILVPLNWRLAAAEHGYILRDCGASVLFAEPVYHEHCRELQADLPDCRFVSIEHGGDTAWPVMADLIASCSSVQAECAGALELPLLIVYTSGTTGFPKGAVLTQQAVLCNAWNSMLMHGMHSGDLILTMLPLFHVGGLNIQTTAAFYAGATVLLQPVFEPGRTLQAITEDRVTLTIILPAHMPALQALPEWPGADLSGLRSVTTGSTLIPETMTAFWHGRGIPLLQVYGSTETCPIAVHQTATNARATEGSIGYPAMHSEIRLVDEAGNDCRVNEPGEFLICGGHVMSGYWNNPEATRAALEDGWFHSGDIGYRDERGCFHFVDRKHEVIISGSENIYPAEVEHLLLSHSDITDAAVVGREDARWGEVVVAVIVLREGAQLDHAGLLQWLDGKLGRYKHPRDMIVVDELPRNAMRKVMKDVIRELVAEPRSVMKVKSNKVIK